MSALCREPGCMNQATWQIRRINQISDRVYESREFFDAHRSNRCDEHLIKDLSSDGRIKAVERIV